MKLSNTKINSVYISLVNFLNWQDTLNVVQQLTGFEYSDLKISIGVVDNASPNDSYDQLKRQLPDTIQVTLANSNEGYAAGHTVNLKRAIEENPDYFWVLNSDVELFKNTLKELIKICEQFNDHALIGSVTLSNPNTIDFGGSAWTSNDKKFHYNDWNGKSRGELLKEHPECYRVQSLEGSSLFIPMRIIEQFGFMKTDFFMYGEETDYCLRLDKKGIPNYIATRSQLIHQNEGSMSSADNATFLRAYYRRRNHLRIQKEHFGMSSFQALGYPGGVVENFKTWVQKRRDVNYFYALGSIHAALNIKGKRI